MAKTPPPAAKPTPSDDAALTAPPAATPPPADVAPVVPVAPPAVPAKRGAVPMLRAHAAWVDHLGLGVRVEAGQCLDWSDPAVQRLFRGCLNWQAFGVEFVDVPIGKAEAMADLADATSRIAALQAQVASLTARSQHFEDEAAKAVAQAMAELSEQVAKLQATVDERDKQLVEASQKLQAAIAGERQA